MKTMYDLARQFKADTGFQESLEPEMFQNWIRNKYLEMLNVEKPLNKMIKELKQTHVK